MSTAPVSSSSIFQEVQSYFQQRNSDLQQLGQALQSGDLATAQKEYQAIQTLGQSGPFANGDPFRMSAREQAFQAIGQALQAGDLAGAKQAFLQLKGSFLRGHADPPTLGGPTTPLLPASGQPVAGEAATSAAGPEIVVNLGNITPGEQITIGLNNAGNGTEQVTIGVAGQGQSPEQITLNMKQNSNEQIVLDLFNGTASTPAQNSGVNLTA